MQYKRRIPHKIIDPIILNDRNYVKNIGLELKIYTLENVTTKSPFLKEM